MAAVVVAKGARPLSLLIIGCTVRTSLLCKRLLGASLEVRERAAGVIGPSQKPTLAHTSRNVCHVACETLITRITAHVLFWAAWLPSWRPT
jgi:hypothetical protein